MVFFIGYDAYVMFHDVNILNSNEKTNYLSLYIDSETGVNYLIDDKNSGTITVRVDKDGMPYVNKTADDMSIVDKRCIQAVVDPTIGVNYFIYDRNYFNDGNRYTHGMTIRVNTDGTPYVTPLDEVNKE